MVNGDGFFAVQKENGELLYTRDGALKLDASGRVVNSSGYPMVPSLTVPPATSKITISPLGLVEALDANGKSQQIGQIELATFTNQQGLRNVGGNMYQVTEASGAPSQGNPGANGIGVIEQGKLETSNVNMVGEMVNMIQAQRAYEMNAKVMQAADQMLQVSTNVLK
jgi:flagellar basal-body rod protein FlgG